MVMIETVKNLKGHETEYTKGGCAKNKPQPRHDFIIVITFLVGIADSELNLKIVQLQINV